MVCALVCGRWWKCRLSCSERGTTRIAPLPLLSSSAHSATALEVACLALAWRATHTPTTRHDSRSRVGPSSIGDWADMKHARQAKRLKMSALTAHTCTLFVTPDRVCYTYRVCSGEVEDGDACHAAVVLFLFLYLFRFLFLYLFRFLPFAPVMTTCKSCVMGWWGPQHSPV